MSQTKPSWNALCGIKNTVVSEHTDYKRTSKLIRHKWPVMLNIRWVNPRLYQILQTRFKYLRVAQAFKNKFNSEKTYSKKAKIRSGESRSVSLYLHAKFYTTDRAQIRKSYFS